jgi:hypothetical protein
MLRQLNKLANDVAELQQGKKDDESTIPTLSARVDYLEAEAALVVVERTSRMAYEVVVSTLNGA